MAAAKRVEREHERLQRELIQVRARILELSKPVRGPRVIESAHRRALNPHAAHHVCEPAGAVERERAEELRRDVRVLEDDDLCPEELVLCEVAPGSRNEREGPQDRGACRVRVSGVEDPLGRELEDVPLQFGR